MPTNAVGARLKTQRRARGETQASLAAKVGVSTSYLNLIENGKRAVGGMLLRKLAQALELPLGALSAAGDHRALEELREIAVDPLLREQPPDPMSASDFLGRHGDWASALLTLHRSWRERDRAAAALSDRLNQDPFLSEAVHTILGGVAAIRSTSDLLDNVQDMKPEQRRRFYKSLAEESGRLADVSRALAGFFDQRDLGGPSLTPDEEVDDFIAARGNFFATMEDAAADLRFAARLEEGRQQSRLVDYLRTRFGVETVRTSFNEQVAAHRFDPETRRLSLSDTAPETTRRFQIARLAFELAHTQAIDADIAAAAELKSPAAKARARRALASYGAAATLMPYAEYLSAAEATRYDIAALARRFAASHEQAAHRAATLRKPNAQGLPFAFMRADPSGFVTKRLALPGLALPRLGGACPLWAIYQAFQTPETVVRQLAEFPNGDRFFVVAMAVAKEGASHERPRHLLSIMLATPAAFADRWVYSDGVALGPRAQTTQVGPSCRLCIRRQCAYRQEASPLDQDAEEPRTLSEMEP